MNFSVHLNLTQQFAIQMEPGSQAQRNSVPVSMFMWQASYGASEIAKLIHVRTHDIN